MTIEWNDILFLLLLNSDGLLQSQIFIVYSKIPGHISLRSNEKQTKTLFVWNKTPKRSSDQKYMQNANTRTHSQPDKQMRSYTHAI